MSCILRAPYPTANVTTTLPDPNLSDSRASESSIIIKRPASKDADLWTYAKTSDRQTLTLPFTLTLQKSLELEAFIKSYQSARWFVGLDHDGSEWDAQLTDAAINRSTIGKYGPDVRTGDETIEVTLIFSAKRLN